MQTVLFNQIIFGPIHSRRLGVSLGVNLLPLDGKVCSFDCVYCEAGYNAQGRGTTGLPTREQVRDTLDTTLREMKEAGKPLDVITFSGNGEPTLHPMFAEVVDDTLALRDRYYPEVKVSVLSNSTRLTDNSVFDALCRVDNNIMKLDSAYDETMRNINYPKVSSFDVESVVNNLCRFNGQLIVQTMFLRGEHLNKIIDNTTDAEINALIDAYAKIAPREIMIYTIDRATPEKNLEKLSKNEMDSIALKIREKGFNVQVSY